MNVVMVSSEMVPFVKRGGLADVVGSLSKVLVRRGHKVSVFVPFYKVVDVDRSNLREAFSSVDIWIDGMARKAKFLHTTADGVDVYFVDNPHYFDREEVYSLPTGDYPDNAQRFAFFSAAVVNLIVSGLDVDIVHCNDWETALVPVYLKKQHGLKVPVLLTIHNLAYQGVFPKDVLPRLGLSWELFNVDALEFYGNINLLKGGIVFSDVINTVSPTYSKEIQTQEFGFGLDGVLRSRRDSLYGILNGIDTDYWNPETDKSIYQNYSAKELPKKRINKIELRRELGLKLNEDTPLVGWVSRLVDQKGFDLFAVIAEELLESDLDMVILGSGEERYQNLLKDLSSSFEDRLAVRIGFDPILANKIYAGSDMFLMPSRFEPCGLGQMIALRYGAIPIVRRTGGLADTVFDYNEDKVNGNGFVFKDYKPEAFFDAVARALSVYKNQKEWLELAQKGMKIDFSWSKSAKEYEDLYSIAVRKGNALS